MTLTKAKLRREDTRRGIILPAREYANVELHLKTQTIALKWDFNSEGEVEVD